MSVRFYIGLHKPGHARHFERACISIAALQRRVRPVDCPDVLVDSGAFSEIALHGGYRAGVADYAAQLRRLAGIVSITAAVAQDYMCEPFMLAKTGLSVADHQRLTIERYDALIAEDLPFPVMPVLQGYEPGDYAAHIRAYGDRLTPNLWVGVGSVCKRNSKPDRIVEVLAAIHGVRPDLRLHGFGVKRTALANAGVLAMLDSADSMAWSFAARYGGRNSNSAVEAIGYAAQVEAGMRLPQPWQMPLPFWRAA